VPEFFKYFDVGKKNRRKEDALDRKTKKVTLKREWFALTAKELRILKTLRRIPSRIAQGDEKQL
jgi:DNA-binding response OmpR family regulator